MLFSDLVDSELDPAVRMEIDMLLDLKMNAPELKLIPKVSTLNAYMDQCIQEIEQKLDQMPDSPQNDWDELNKLFLEIIGF